MSDNADSKSQNHTEIRQAVSDANPLHGAIQAALQPQQEEKSGTNAGRSLSGPIILLCLIIACFHPWTKQFIEDTVSITPLLLLVLIFVYVVNPIVEFILNQIRRLPGAKFFSYTKSLIITYVLILLSVLGSIAAITPKLIEEVKVLADNFPIIAQRATVIVADIRQNHFEALPADVQERISSAIAQLSTMAGSLIQSSIQYAGAFSSTIMWVATAAIMVPFISYYMLSDGKDLVKFWVELVPGRQRPGLMRILLQVHEAMKSFIKGQAILCAAVGAVTTLLVALVMPKYCVALGLIAGITEAIPIIGPILGALPAVLLALAVPETGGITLALIVAGIYILIQQLENNLLVPKIMGDSLGLHPLSLMLGMMVFANVFGFWGVVLASPIVATVKVIVIHCCNPELEMELMRSSGLLKEYGIETEQNSDTECADSSTEKPAAKDESENSGDKDKQDPKAGKHE